MLVEGIPNHLVQNMASIQSNINSIMSGFSQSSPVPSMSFENILASTFEDDNDFGSFDNVRVVNQPYQNNTSMSKPENLENIPTNTIDKIPMNSTDTTQNHEETKNIVQNAYSSILNGDIPEKIDSSPSLSSIAPNILNKITDKAQITDKEFFNAESLTPEQITDILKKKNSPFANLTFEGGKSVGQLIYDFCHQAGTLEKGSHKLNPAMVLGIMGAESMFGIDKKRPNNPFNIRLNGSFDNINNFESSLKIAINTMYNWAVSKPSDVKVSLFDYAGDKYCENYQKEWKPNVEKYYTEFSSLNLFDSNKLDMIKDILAKTNNNTSSNININTLMSMANGSNGGNMSSVLNMIPSSSNLFKNFESEV